MKKIIAITILVLMLLSVTACFGNKATVTNPKEETSNAKSQNDKITSSTIANSDSGITIVPGLNETLMIPAKWSAKHGEYFTQLNTTNLLVYITDKNTGVDIVLCNKPNCEHDTSDCNAFLPLESQNSAENQITPQTNGCVFVVDEYLYALNGKNTIYRMCLDGTERTLQANIPDKFVHGSLNWLYNDKLYMLGHTIIMNDDLSGYSVQVLLEIDYINNTSREIWVEEKLGTSTNPTGENQVIGIWDERAFIRQTLYAPLIRTQEGMVAYDDDQDVLIYSIDLRTNQKKNIISDKSVGLFTHYSFVLEDSSATILYHSRRESSLIHLNLLTGETSVLSDQLHEFIHLGEKYGDKRILTRKNGRDDLLRWETDDWVNKPSDDLLFYDYATGEVKMLDFKTKLNIGQSLPMHILYEETDYFYVDVERELKKDDYGNYRAVRRQVGRIKKDDFWLNNEKALEVLEWEDWDYLN